MNDVYIPFQPTQSHVAWATNTCYMDVVLQLFLNYPPFLKTISNLNPDSFSESERDVLKELKKLVSLYLNGQKITLSLFRHLLFKHKFFETFFKDKSEYDYNCADEFFYLLINYLLELDEEFNFLEPFLGARSIKINISENENLFTHLELNSFVCGKNFEKFFGFEKYYFLEDNYFQFEDKTGQTQLESCISFELPYLGSTFMSFSHTLEETHNFPSKFRVQRLDGEEETYIPYSLVVNMNNNHFIVRINNFDGTFSEFDGIKDKTIKKKISLFGELNSNQKANRLIYISETEAEKCYGNFQKLTGNPVIVDPYEDLAFYISENCEHPFSVLNDIAKSLWEENKEKQEFLSCFKDPLALSKALLVRLWKYVSASSLFATSNVNFKKLECFLPKPLTDSEINEGLKLLCYFITHLKSKEVLKSFEIVYGLYPEFFDDLYKKYGTTPSLLGFSAVPQIKQYKECLNFICKLKKTGQLSAVIINLQKEEKKSSNDPPIVPEDSTEQNKGADEEENPALTDPPKKIPGLLSTAYPLPPGAVYKGPPEVVLDLENPPEDVLIEKLIQFLQDTMRSTFVSRIDNRTERNIREFFQVLQEHTDVNPRNFFIIMEFVKDTLKQLQENPDDIRNIELQQRFIDMMKTLNPYVGEFFLLHLWHLFVDVMIHIGILRGTDPEREFAHFADMCDSERVKVHLIPKILEKLPQIGKEKFMPLKVIASANMIK